MRSQTSAAGRSPWPWKSAVAFALSDVVVRILECLVQPNDKILEAASTSAPERLVQVVQEPRSLTYSSRS